MRFSVAKLAPALVIPAEQTPAETLQLSSFDRWLATLRYIVMDMVLVFGPDVDEPADVIKKALAKALVGYYPVAGRIVQDSNTGQLEVDCSGQGVWFVEASAEFRLDDVESHETSPPMMAKDQLFPTPPPEVSLYDLPLSMQVTKFKCGGFTLAIRFNHAIFDGRGIGQFVKSVSEIAGDDPSHPPVKPVWRRDVLPVSSRLPPGIPPLSTLNLKTFKFEHLVMDISMYAVNALKKEYTESTGQNCTAFEILAAKIWQCRTRAIEIAADVDVSLTFGADVRRLQSALPAEGGYYGNCIYNVFVRAPSAKIAHGSVADIVNLIKNSKEILRSRMTKWLEGDAEEDPYKMGMGYESLLLTDWRRTGLFDAEFRSRKPFHATPVGDPRYFGTCGLLNSPEPKQAVRLLMTCVSEQHLKAFHDEMKGTICVKDNVTVSQMTTCRDPCKRLDLQPYVDLDASTAEEQKMHVPDAAAY